VGSASGALRPGLPGAYDGGLPEPAQARRCGGGSRCGRRCRCRSRGTRRVPPRLRQGVRPAAVRPQQPGRARRRSPRPPGQDVVHGLAAPEL